MHPEVTATAPGACPECGMQLVPVPISSAAPPSYTCPMHPEVTAPEPGTCPQCGMKLVPAAAAPRSTAVPHAHAGADGHAPSDGIEWADLMPASNRASDTSNMI
jgi:hypothetical protein